MANQLFTTQPLAHERLQGLKFLFEFFNHNGVSHALNATHQHGIVKLLLRSYLGDNSMAEKREAKKGRTIADPQDLHDVVKAALLEAQFPVGTL